MPSNVFDSIYFKDRYGTEPMRAIWDDLRTFQAWLDVEVALAWAQAECGLFPKSVAREIQKCARVEDLDLNIAKQAFDRTWNPVVPIIEACRNVLPPPSARFLHWGATSKNIFDTGMILQTRQACTLLLSQLGLVEAELARLSELHRRTVMAGRTHGQHALPVSFGFQCATWLDELMRRRQRLSEAHERVLFGEFGGAVGTLASLGRRGLKVQRLMMERLKLSVPAVPVKTAGDRLAEFTLSLAMLSASLGKAAQNVYNLQRTDVDEAEEFTDGKVGSSAMPHKRNPVASGSVVLLGRLMKPNAISALEYVHAEGEDDHRQGETAWKFLPESCLLVSAQLEILRKVLVGLVVKPDRMLSNLRRAGGFVFSESVLMALAPKLGRQQAHDLVTDLANRARDSGSPFTEAVLNDSRVRQVLKPREIAACLDFRRAMGLAPLFADRIVANYRRRESKAAAATRKRRPRHKRGSAR